MLYFKTRNYNHNFIHLNNFLLKKKFKIFEFPTKENPRIYGKSVNPPIKSGIGHIILIIKEFFKK